MCLVFVRFHQLTGDSTLALRYWIFLRPSGRIVLLEPRRRGHLYRKKHHKTHRYIHLPRVYPQAAIAHCILGSRGAIGGGGTALMVLAITHAVPVNHSLAGIVRYSRADSHECRLGVNNRKLGRRPAAGRPDSAAVHAKAEMKSLKQSFGRRGKVTSTHDLSLSKQYLDAEN